VATLPGCQPYNQNPNSGHQSRLALQSMDMLGLSSSVQRGDEYYREQWRLYYAERRRLLTRMFWIAGGLGVFFLLLSFLQNPPAPVSASAFEAF